jgi:hypothetical protein
MSLRGGQSLTKQSTERFENFFESLRLLLIQLGEDHRKGNPSQSKDLKQ